jgi:hypothetical protein
MTSLLAWIVLAGQVQPEPSFEERKLATIPESAELPRLTVFGRNGTSVLYLSKVKEGWSVFTGDRQGEVFEEIKLFYNFDLHDATTAPYFGIAGGRRFLLQQNRREGPFDPGKQNDYAYVTPAGGLYYIGQEAGQRFLFFKGRRGKSYDGLAGPYPSDDGRVVGCVATVRGRGSCVVVGHREEDWFDDIHWGPSFSPDTRSVGYAARKGEDWFVVVDGKPGPSFDYVQAPEFSPDGKSFAYKANLGGRPSAAGAEGGRFLVVSGGRKSKDYDEIRALQFTPDGRTCFIATRDGKELIVLGEQELPAHDQVSLPSFSRDGKRLAYGAKEGTRWTLHLDGKSLGPADGDTFRFSPDGSAFAFVRREAGRAWIVLDDREGAKHDDIIQLRWSPDGKRMAYWAKDEGSYRLVLGDRRSGPLETFDYLPWFISPDGKKAAYPARIGRELWWKVLQADEK